MKSTLTAVSNSRIFVDTNILYYGNDYNSENGKQAKERIGDLQLQKNSLHISGQVIREYTQLTLRNATYKT